MEIDNFIDLWFRDVQYVFRIVLTIDFILFGSFQFPPGYSVRGSVC